MVRRRRKSRFRSVKPFNAIYFVSFLIVLVIVLIIIILIKGISRNYVGNSNNPTTVIIELPEITNSPSPTIDITPNPTPKVSPLQPQVGAKIQEGFINKSGVNFRKVPNGEIIDTLREGSTINIIGTEVEGFYHISYKDTFGYVATQFISFGKYTPKPTPKPTPSPTPRYGRWDRDDYLLLATTIYCESSVQGGLPEAVAIGWVIRNRLEDKHTWGDETWLDVISRKGQFSVYSKNSSSKFQKTLKKISSEDDGHYATAKRAARYVMQGRDKYKIPEEVQFFCSNSYYKSVKKSNGNWASHEYYDRIGDTVFFYH